MRSACVVVLGDIGRSPRMCNHAVSLAEKGVKVSLIGYGGASPIEAVRQNSNIDLVHLSPVPKLMNKLPRAVSYPLKAVWQFFTLMTALPMWSAPDLLLLQNPPSVPTLVVCQLYCKLLTVGRTRLAVDWHNYGYSIMAMAHREGSALVKLCEWVERTFGRGAAVNFSVTEAMRRDLLGEWGLDNVVTLYDRPPEQFRPLGEEERTEFLDRMGNELGEAFLDMENKGLLVSSTSWTEDEDFGLLLHALDEYESAREADNNELPPLVCAITGRGPMKEYYCEQIEKRNWQHVTVSTPWLEAEDYPRLLACADLGVSLHSSSSGLDLPMKVVDMMGCGTPVAALSFRSLPELVRHGQNGLAFSDRAELAAQLQDWFRGLPAQRRERRRRFEAELDQFRAVRWREYWLERAWPELLAACNPS